jgi:hypothetical protein
MVIGGPIRRRQENPGGEIRAFSSRLMAIAGYFCGRPQGAPNAGVFKKAG